jgi:trimeric autotransporter adhesin
MRRSMLCSLLVAVACGEGGGPSLPPVASITLTAPSTGPLTSLGDTLQLTAKALDATGTPIAGVGILFTSSNAAAATVNQVGLVTAVANGTTTVHASAEGKEATVDVTVAQVVAQVLVTPASIRVPQGETPLFHASAVDARNHPVAGAAPTVWSTTDSSTATIGADGRAAVSGTAADGATVSAVATVGSLASTAGGLMTIDSTAVYVETITVTAQGPTSFSKLNDTVQLSAGASNPRQGDVTSSVTFTWSSSVPGVAGVSTAGVVTALGNGNSAITATSNGVSGSLGVTVSQVPASVTIAAPGGGSSASLASLGATVSLVGTAFDAGNSPIPGVTFTWSSDATSIATVSTTGVVKAITNGTAHVTARTSNQVASAAFPVTVQQVVASVSVLPTTATIPRCTTQQFTATPRDALGNTIASAPAPSWASAGTAVATVDGNGLATSVTTGGPVAIRATIAGFTGSAQLTVNSSPIVVNWPGTAATNPPTLTTCQGQTIVWYNTDPINSHTATGTNGSPFTGNIQPGANSPAQSFPGPGTYPYHCDYHPNETGTVVIQ